MCVRSSRFCRAKRHKPPKSWQKGAAIHNKTSSRDLGIPNGHGMTRQSLVIPYPGILEWISTEPSQSAPGSSLYAAGTSNLRCNFIPAANGCLTAQGALTYRTVVQQVLQVLENSEELVPFKFPWWSIQFSRSAPQKFSSHRSGDMHWF